MDVKAGAVKLTASIPPSSSENGSTSVTTTFFSSRLRLNQSLWLQSLPMLERFVAAAHAYCTLGEIAGVLREEFGEYSEA